MSDAGRSGPAAQFPAPLKDCAVPRAPKGCVLIPVPSKTAQFPAPLRNEPSPVPESVPLLAGLKGRGPHPAESPVPAPPTENELSLRLKACVPFPVP